MVPRVRLSFGGLDTTRIGTRDADCLSVQENGKPKRTEAARNGNERERTSVCLVFLVILVSRVLRDELSYSAV
jgi:hypothetical protein